MKKNYINLSTATEEEARDYARMIFLLVGLFMLLWSIHLHALIIGTSNVILLIVTTNTSIWVSDQEGFFMLQLCMPDACTTTQMNLNFAAKSKQHAGILLASVDIDPKLEYGPWAVFLLYHDERFDSAGEKDTKKLEHKYHSACPLS